MSAPTSPLLPSVPTQQAQRTQHAPRKHDVKNTQKVDDVYEPPSPAARPADRSEDGSQDKSVVGRAREKVTPGAHAAWTAGGLALSTTAGALTYAFLTPYLVVMPAVIASLIIPYVTHQLVQKLESPSAQKAAFVVHQLVLGASTAALLPLIYMTAPLPLVAFAGLSLAAAALSIVGGSMLGHRAADKLSRFLHHPATRILNVVAKGATLAAVFTSATGPAGAALFLTGAAVWLVLDGLQLALRGHARADGGHSDATKNVWQQAAETSRSVSWFVLGAGLAVGARLRFLLHRAAQLL